MVASRLWGSRFSWSGEIPADFPGLNPVALNRVDNTATGEYRDAVAPERVWKYHSGTDNAISWGAESGPMGDAMRMNAVAPTTEHGRVQLDHFPDLWPDSGRLLVGLWARQDYSMAFNPLLDTRATDPFVYLSTARGSGRARFQLYDTAGSLLLDNYEADPYAGTTDWRFIGALVDFDAGNAQVFTVDRAGHESFLGPVRTFSGTANTDTTANLDVFSLRHADYYESGRFDEVVVAHPAPDFSVEDFAEALRLGTWAAGQDETAVELLEVTDSRVKATSSGMLATGAESVAWSYAPVLGSVPDNSTAYLSDDGGDTWTSTGPDELPAAFEGLMRWEVPLLAGHSFDGIDAEFPGSPAPELSPITDAIMEQGEIQALPLTFSVDGPASWAFRGTSLVTAEVVDGALELEAGFEVGEASLVVELADDTGRTVSRSVDILVEARTWGAAPVPAYPHAPIILWDDDGPAEVLADPLEAVITKEVNGEESLDFTIPAKHKHAGRIQNERIVEAAGDKWWVRRVTTERSGQNITLKVKAEARFYELTVAGQVDGRDWNGVVAGTVMRAALAGTGWKVDVANVTTRRSYELEDGNPLEVLRKVQEYHGGDLVFDNERRLVSLVVQSGRDNGVAFFNTRGLTDSKRVVDTTTLVTRIRPRNADGLGIESVNGGRPYLEDFGYSSEVKEAVYDFKAGTSALTMLAMAQATLANRSRPAYSYEVTVNDLSTVTGDELDRFDVGDRVTVVDPDVGIEAVSQRIVKLEYDIVRPWASEITLSAKLRETGGGDSEDASTLRTGSQVSSFDLVPFNLLFNSRFDNGLAHWAHSGVGVVESGHGTGDYAVEFAGSGSRWIEQTIQPDNREAYAFSMDLDTRGPSGWVPELTVEAVVEYEDGETETIVLDVS